MATVEFHRAAWQPSRHWEATPNPNPKLVTLTLSALEAHRRLLQAVRICSSCGAAETDTLVVGGALIEVRLGYGLG